MMICLARRGKKAHLRLVQGVATAVPAGDHGHAGLSGDFTASVPHHLTAWEVQAEKKAGKAKRQPARMQATGKRTLFPRLQLLRRED